MAKTNNDQKWNVKKMKIDIQELYDKSDNSENIHNLRKSLVNIKSKERKTSRLTNRKSTETLSNSQIPERYVILNKKNSLRNNQPLKEESECDASFEDSLNQKKTYNFNFKTKEKIENELSAGKIEYARSIKERYQVQKPNNYAEINTEFKESPFKPRSQPFESSLKDKESHKEIIHNLENLLKLEKTDEAADSDAELNDIDDFVEDLQAMIVKFKRDRKKNSKQRTVKNIQPTYNYSNLEYNANKTSLEVATTNHRKPHEILSEPNSYLKSDLHNNINHVVGTYNFSQIEYYQNDFEDTKTKRSVRFQDEEDDNNKGGYSRTNRRASHK